MTPNRRAIPASAQSSSAPFCAVRVFPADAASCTGLKTDSYGRVLGTDDLPIDGLYACGNDMASILQGIHIQGPERPLALRLYSATAWGCTRIARASA
ncbi:FAD-binding protein [Cupriavidus basilensis]